MFFQKLSLQLQERFLCVWVKGTSVGMNDSISNQTLMTKIALSNSHKRVESTCNVVLHFAVDLIPYYLAIANHWLCYCVVLSTKDIVMQRVEVWSGN